MRLSMLVFVTLASGCLTADTFNQAATSASCERFEECNAETFALLYDDQADCEATFDQFPENDCQDKHCTYNGAAASQCVRDIRTSACPDDEGATDDGESPCGDVWTECDEVELLACFVQEGLDAIFDGGE